MWNTILIGLGRIGWQLELDKKRYHPCTHGGTLKLLQNKFNLIGICDRNLNKIQSFLNWWSQNSHQKYSIKTNTNYKDLLNQIQQKIDFAIITTGPDFHIEILDDLMNYPIKSILIEKPLAYNTKQLNEIKKKFNQNLDINIYINFERRYHPYYQKVKQMIEKETLGKLKNIHGRVFAPSIKRDPLLEDGIHWIDLLIWYIGKPEILFSFWEINESGIEERSLHILRKKDILIQLESGGKRDYFEFSMVLDFEKGRIEIGNFGIKIFRKAISNRYEKFYELKEIPVKIPFKNPWIEMYHYIYNQNQSNFEDAYTGISLYEELKKYANHY